MNWLDIAIIIPIAFGLIRGFLKGFIQELLGLVAVILGILIAKLWGPSMADLVNTWIDGPAWAANLLSYLIVFFAIVIACVLVSKFLGKLVKAISINWLNKLLGAFFGGLKWMLFVSLMLNLLVILEPKLQLIDSDTKAKAAFYDPALQAASVTWSTASPYLPTISLTE